MGKKIVLPKVLKPWILPEDVKQGEPSLDACPIALATKRMLPRGYTVQVDEDDVLVFNTKHKKIATYLHKLEKRIKKFDRSGKMRTGEVTLTQKA